MTRGVANPERSFGISVGAVLLAIAAYFFWRGRISGAEVLGTVGAFLLIAGLTRPTILRVPSGLWWRFSRALGYVNARIILTVMFMLGFATIGLIWRLTGHDPLGRRRSAWPGWSPYPVRYRQLDHYKRMY
jgi:saxitoxin biosynthesis operon SxtJ-like protein